MVGAESTEDNSGMQGVQGDAAATGGLDGMGIARGGAGQGELVPKAADELACKFQYCWQPAWRRQGG